MSGPKTSKYTLTPEQRRQLEEQRKLERRRVIAKKSIAASLRTISDIFIKLDTYVTGESVKLASDIIKMRTEFESLKEKIAACSETDADSLEAAAKLASESAKSALTYADTLLNEAKNNSEATELLTRSEITASFADAVTHNESELEKKRSADIRKLTETSKLDNLPDSYRNELDMAIGRLKMLESLEFARNYSAVTVIPLIKKCTNYAKEYQKLNEEFDRLMLEYSALCEIHGIMCVNYPCTSESVSVLKSEIARINADAASDDEQSYIAECMDEVMEEMGYNVLGSRQVTKKNGKHFESELYSYSDGTAVNVTYSSDGRIVMELGGISDTDRPPTDSETAYLCREMERFCNDFSEIEKRLLAKGVILADRLTHLPPNEEYAQIISTSDYTMHAHAASLQAQKRKKRAKKPKAKHAD